MTVIEEAERFVITHDPCGSGGKLRRKGQFGVTKHAYQWSWGKAGVPYYCTHYISKQPKLIPDKYFTRLGHSPKPKDG